MAPTPLHGPLMLRDLLVVPTCCTFQDEGLSRHPTRASPGPSSFVCAGGAWPPSDVVRVCGRRGRTHHSTSGSGHYPTTGLQGLRGQKRGARLGVSSHPVAGLAWSEATVFGHQPWQRHLRPSCLAPSFANGQMCPREGVRVPSVTQQRCIARTLAHRHSALHPSNYFLLFDET